MFLSCCGICARAKIHLTSPCSAGLYFAGPYLAGVSFTGLCLSLAYHRAGLRKAMPGSASLHFHDNDCAAPCFATLFFACLDVAVISFTSLAYTRLCCDDDAYNISKPVVNRP